MSAFALVLALAQSQGDVVRVEAGPLTIEVHSNSTTAHLFHVVDQMSAWSEFCHAQYAKWWTAKYGPFTDQDKSLLAKHTSIRKKFGWDGTLEKTYYTGSPLREALDGAVKAGRLSQGDADAERDILSHFAPKIEELRKEQVVSTAGFVQTLLARKTELSAFASKAARLFGTKHLTLPVFLIADPDEHSYGGGFNGGIIVLEVPAKTSVYPTLLHESFHAFIDPHRGELEAAARGIPGLDEQTLNEGLAYALAPGIFLWDSSTGDPLARQVESDIRAEKRLDDSYTRFNRFALAIRPIVRQALDDETKTIKDILPRMLEAWGVVRELSEGMPHRALIYSIGPGWETLNDLTWQQGLHLKSYEFGKGSFESILGSARPGSTLVLLYTPELAAKYRALPKEYADLLPTPIADVESALAKGETFEKSGMIRGLKVVLLAARTTQSLGDLVKSTTLLK